jgi:hypothetical protein
MLDCDNLATPRTNRERSMGKGWPLDGDIDGTSEALARDHYKAVERRAQWPSVAWVEGDIAKRSGETWARAKETKGLQTQPCPNTIDLEQYLSKTDRERD